MLHALINNVDALGVVSPNSVLAVLGGDAIPQSHKEVGVIVGGMEALNEAHAFAALQGDTAHQPIDTPINLHFVCFVGIGGRCLELDGRQDAPILHGECTDGPSLLAAAAKAIEERMKLDPNSLEFSITALVPANSEGGI
ncbi:ubiquitin carboxyl-terminal hydrolase L3 [Strigomonas culicis]|nr:ubiquitin carboxyl-terminal hydrolase L3 [Strigomonas culicis]|eukprot:EPY24480.1 ubiquitin carboxyl-terminal hydrolase L3 [Strigomonas culicis]